MKFQTYLYIDHNGDVVEATKIPARAVKSKVICLKVTADIPDEHFQLPTFVVDFKVPPPTTKPSGGSVQDWLTKEVEILDEKENSNEDIVRDIIPSYDPEDIPF